jgi:hypothetical protein
MRYLPGIALLLILTAAFPTSAQIRNTDPKTAPKTVRVNIHPHLGSVEIPDGFDGYVGANWNDAWAGSLDSSDGRVKITWRAGIIEYVSEKRKEEIIWRDVENTPDFAIQLARLRNVNGDTLVARIGELEFSSPVSTKDNEDLFLSIVRSFRKERCYRCRSLPFRIKQ